MTKGEGKAKLLECLGEKYHSDHLLKRQQAVLREATKTAQQTLDDAFDICVHPDFVGDIWRKAEEIVNAEEVPDDRT